MSITWDTSSPPSNSWYAAAIDGTGRIVAAADDATGSTAYKDPGGSWTAGGDIGFAPYGMCYGNGKFFVWDQTNQAASSTDGAAWTAITLPVSTNWSACLWVEELSLFVLLAFGEPFCYTSPTGATGSWTSRTMPSDNFWNALAWNGTHLVAVAANASNTAAARTTDGITWAAVTLPTPSGMNSQQICWSEALGLFVIVGYASGKSMSSPTGATGDWTLHDLPATQDWYNVAPFGTDVIAISDYAGNDTALFNGTAWVADTDMPGAETGWYAYAATDTLFVALSYDTDTAASQEFVEITAIEDGMGMATSTVVQPVAVALADLEMDQTITTTEVNALRDGLVMAGAPTTVALRLATLAESFGMLDQVQLILEGNINETLALADAATLEKWVLVTLVDSLRISGGATGTLAAIAQISEALGLLGAARTVVDGQITDDLELIDDIVARVSALENLMVDALFNDSATSMASVVVQVDDGFSLDETLTPQQALTAAINEGLRFAVGFVFDGTPIMALSLNAATKSVTNYTSYPFNSMAAFGRRYYGAGEGGLYELDGDTDAGEEIVWRIRTGMSTLGTGRNKALDAAYLGLTASGKVALKCIVVDATTGEKIVHWYELTENAAVTPRGRRLLVGRGLKSVYWGFELTNVDAGDIELDVVELHPIVLEGRL